MNGENSVKLTDKVKKNSSELVDLSVRIAGIRGLLFKNEPRCRESECDRDKPSTLDDEVEYQSVLLSEINKDLDEIERRL